MEPDPAVPTFLPPPLPGLPTTTDRDLPSTLPGLRTLVERALPPPLGGLPTQVCALAWCGIQMRPRTQNTATVKAATLPLVWRIMVSFGRCSCLSSSFLWQHSRGWLVRCLS